MHIVNKRMSSLKEGLVRVYVSETDNCQEAKSQQIEKTPQRMAALQHTLYVRINEGDVRRVL